jgi:hypothetical protein
MFLLKGCVVCQGDLVDEHDCWKCVHCGREFDKELRPFKLTALKESYRKHAVKIL